MFFVPKPGVVDSILPNDTTISPDKKAEMQESFLTSPFPAPTIAIHYQVLLISPPRYLIQLQTLGDQHTYLPKDFACDLAQGSQNSQ